MTTDLRAALAEYLHLRRGLGFGLRRDEKLLTQFLDYLDGLGRTMFSVDDTLAWAKLPTPASPGWLGMRLSMVRSFAAYLHSLDPTVPVPPPGLLPGRGCRVVPYLYSDADLAALLQQTQTLKTTLRRATLRTLIGLLAATGLRMGEALAADDEDFDADAGVLLVRHGKFDKQRLLPLHPSTVTALNAYRAVRDARFPPRSARRCWSRRRDPGWSTSTSASPTPASPARPDWSLARRRVGRDRTICATRSRFALCSTGIATRLTLTLVCPCCRPTWGTWRRTTPTGISTPRPS